MPATSPNHGGELGKIRQFLLDHERLLIVGIAAIVIWLGYVKITNIIEEHDKAQLQQAQIVAAQQAEKNAALAQQVQQDAAQLKLLTDRLEAQNAQLENANVQLATALSKQQKTDATLPPTDLANRWMQLTPNMPPGGVAVASNGTMNVTPAGAVATTQQLEQVPVLKQQLDNTEKAKANDEQIIAQQTTSIGNLDLRVDGLNKQIVANDKVCQEQIKVVKDEARKSKRKWFIIGWVTGFVSRQLLLSKGGF